MASEHDRRFVRVSEEELRRWIQEQPLPPKLLRNLARLPDADPETRQIEHWDIKMDRPLSDRERQVLLAVGDGGLQSAEAAAALGLAVETVKSHLRTIRAKLRAKTTAQAVARAIRAGLI